VIGVVPGALGDLVWDAFMDVAVVVRPGNVRAIP